MKGVGAGTRIFDLLAREPVISPNKGKTLPPGSIGTVKFENIRFAYPQRRESQVLNGFNMEIKPGESVALVYASLTPTCAPQTNQCHFSGRSGSGKSSVQALMLRFYDVRYEQI
jgi:ABC-type multidrug transport system fused ATPase/permease subunit